MKQILTFLHLRHETLEVSEIIWPQGGGGPWINQDQVVAIWQYFLKNKKLIFYTLDFIDQLFIPSCYINHIFFKLKPIAFSYFTLEMLM